MSRRVVAWTVRLVAIAAVGAGVWWMIRGLDLARLATTLAHASLPLVALATVVNVGLLACKAAAWQVLLGPAYPVRFARMFSYTIAMCTASVLLPLRAGEVLRIWLLREREGVPVAHASAVAVAEKLLDVVAIVVVVAPVPWVLRGAPAWVSQWLAILLAVAVLAIVAVAIVAPRVHTTRAAGFFAALSIAHRPRTAIVAAILQIASFVVDLAVIELTLAAVGIDVPLAAGLLVLFTINVSIAVPSTPAQIGALELGAVLGLEVLGVPRDQSVAFAVTYHALQVIPIVLLGLALHGPRLIRSRPSDVRRATAA